MTVSKPRALDVVLHDVLSCASRLDREAWPMEQVGLVDADGRVLAMDVVSPMDVPPWDNSAMDGYAMRLADLRSPGQVLRISARVTAGDSPDTLPPGCAARIFTGAPVPDGANLVLPQEGAEPVADGSEHGAVQIGEIPPLGASIRRRGEDVARGAVVLSKGQRLTPAGLGVAASVGTARLWVARRPKVAFFSTGDELSMPGEMPPAELKPGAIFNSNRFFLHALIARMGCEPIDLGTVGDTLRQTREALSAAAVQADVVISCGGVGAGDEDHVKAALREIGALDLWQLAIKPGKPFAMGRVGPARFMGLPGNPVACFVTFLLLVRPFLLRLQGVVDVEPRSFQVPAGFGYPAVKGRREFPRASLDADGRLQLYPNQSSAVLTSMARGHGLVDLGPASSVAEGDLVTFMPFESLI